MKQKNYSVSPFWDKQALDEKTGMSRVMITVNINSKQFRISLKLKSTKSEFDKQFHQQERYQIRQRKFGKN